MEPQSSIQRETEENEYEGEKERRETYQVARWIEAG